MKLLMIGHLLGDFYFQTNGMAEKKKKSFGYTALHCLFYSLVMFIVLAVTTGKPLRYIIPVLLIGVLHLLADGIKCVLYKKSKLEKGELAVFFIDQFIHFVVLVVVNCIWTIEFNISWLPECFGGIVDSTKKLPIIISAILLCGRPASIIISMVFNLIPKTIEEAKDKEITESQKQENIKIGSWIGMLEREIILILGLLGEYGAIGFVVAAKSLARHSQFDSNPAFAEKYLVGTLLSSIIALFSVIICKVL